MPNALWWTHPVTAADVLPFCGYPKTYSTAYEALLAERFQRLLDDPHAPIHRFLDQKKARRFLSQPKDYGKPWFGQLMAGPQMLAYFLQINHWMEFYCVG